MNEDNMGIKAIIRDKIYTVTDSIKKHPSYDRKDKKITLAELMDELGAELPSKYEDIKDEPISLDFRHDNLKKGNVCMIVRPAEVTNIPDYTSMDQYNMAMEKGARLVIMSKEEAESAGLNEKDHSVILIKKGRRKFYRYIFSLRRRQTGKVVMITGSIGKTTTKDFCYNVIKGSRNTYANIKNTNTVFQVLKHLFEEKNKVYDVFIHEIGAGFKGSLNYISRYYRPDILIVTNVLNHHLQIYKTFDRLFEDKVSADNYLSKNGAVITNFDDENLRKHQFIHRVISFGIEQENVDYRGINIIQKDNILSFDVYEKATGITTHLEVDIYGEHNVYNALAAFALGIEVGLTREEICENLKNFKVSGIRQKMVNVGGVNIDMDCYNVAEESIISMLKMGENFDLDGDGQKIAVIGGENKLGEIARERSLAFGEVLSDIKFDKFLFCGRGDDDESLNIYGDAKDIMETFRKKSTAESEFCDTIDGTAEYLRKNVKRGDLVMLKGIFLLHMPISVDKAFGTSFAYGQSNNKDNMIESSIDGYDIRVIPEFGEAEIVKAKLKKGLLVIPGKVGDYPVFRIGRNAFKVWGSIKRIKFEEGVKNIGQRAFFNCNYFTEIELPSSLRVIEDGAFESCKALKTVKMKDGVTHIGDNAFRNCRNLKDIYIPNSVGMIEENAFELDGSMVIHCQKDSYAYEFAVENDIKFTLI